ncbi:LysR family transcriptional regulator [Lentibacter algarum]|uniref:LysR family transcriptional regulator n=1 Tax=Lentibacter algarum TaxID=576131 RepID=UPI001C07B61B|nr:LysR family transcriptional regulator [Lentibacter algarum]MBU2980768.1 LysR family transcriptional regulator [Lentibacter algarum]
MRNLDITTLRSFLAVADYGGVTRAAGMLNLTQSAVSMQLKRLEELLGVNLLDRSSRKIALSSDGEQLLTFARRMVALNDEAVGRLTEDVFEGEITLGAPHDVVYPIVPQVLKAFHAAYPRVKVRLLSSSTMSLHDTLSKGEADLILTTEAQPLSGGETLTEMPLRWVGAIGGQVWRKTPLPLAFCSSCIFRPLVLSKLELADMVWDMAIESSEDRSVEAMISADLAIGAMMEDSIPPHLEALPANCGLPDLGRQKINLYGAIARDEATAHLADLIRQGYGKAVLPMVRSA